MALVCQVTWTAAPGKAEVVRDALEHLVAASRAESGNILFQPYLSADKPNVIRIFEIYADQAAFDAHGETEHFRTWVLGTAIPALENRERMFYETLDVK
jgi:quinol monooxygenase YgiN